MSSVRKHDQVIKLNARALVSGKLWAEQFFLCNPTNAIHLAKVAEILCVCVCVGGGGHMCVCVCV